jgi:hypothetical protein
VVTWHACADVSMSATCVPRVCQMCAELAGVAELASGVELASGAKMLQKCLETLIRVWIRSKRISPLNFPSSI